MTEDDFVEGVEEHDPFDPLDIERVNVTTLDKSEIEAKKAIDYLEQRRIAYVRVFAGNATADDCKMVMDDLNEFCFGDSTVFHQDERVHCLLTGRQEVIRRIKDHTGLSFDALATKYTRPVNA